MLLRVLRARGRDGSRDKTGFITGENICIDMHPCRRHRVARRSEATEPRSGRKGLRGMTRNMIYHNDFGWRLEN